MDGGVHGDIRKEWDQARHVSVSVELAPSRQHQRGKIRCKHSGKEISQGQSIGEIATCTPSGAHAVELLPFADAVDGIANSNDVSRQYTGVLLSRCDGGREVVDVSGSWLGCRADHQALAGSSPVAREIGAAAAPHSGQRSLLGSYSTSTFSYRDSLSKYNRHCCSVYAMHQFLHLCCSICRTRIVLWFV